MSLRVEELEPAGTSRGTVVLVHGGGLTGRCYWETADMRPGWAVDLSDAGYHVIIAHWLRERGDVGRSFGTGEQISQAFAGLVDSLAGAPTVVVHSMSGPYGFRLAELRGDRLRGLVAIAPGPPANIQPSPRIIREDAHSVTVAQPATEMTLPKAGTWLPSIDFVRKKFIGSSRLFPLEHLEDYYETVVEVPAELIHERVNLNSSQLSIEDSKLFSGLPVLVATGSDDPDHSRSIDARTADWLDSLGADVAFRFVEDEGVTGNGHCPMAETNSRTWATMIADWIGTQSRGN